METKTCTKCGLIKPKSEFRFGQCRACSNARMAEYRKNRMSPQAKASVKEKRKRYRNRNRPILNEKAKVWRLENKQKAFDAYGGRICCWCCENDFDTLTIDHINNDGAKHRKEVFGAIRNVRSGSSGSLYLWMKKNNYPPGFQVLCANCNTAKAINGGILPLGRKDKYLKGPIGQKGENGNHN
jgi:hypothetical protein